MIVPSAGQGHFDGFAGRGRDGNPGGRRDKLLPIRIPPLETKEVVPGEDMPQAETGLQGGVTRDDAQQDLGTGGAFRHKAQSPYTVWRKGRGQADEDLTVGGHDESGGTLGRVVLKRI
jgi:hypothetical protein